MSGPVTTLWAGGWAMLTGRYLGRRRMLVYQGTIRGLRLWLRTACATGTLGEWIAYLSEN